ncbi:neuronal acetylcholine receptor subunit alpha-6-like [Tetranychus urticae]|uniref:Neurotransmitter-gated ion-channel ligand-binding domain-containing protein n=1 Tax=Tetranychus urticae TaxID=32264 RepID=T1KCH3_TETUR|nr:neuronal acetylcholine receptor subunit alpha-6-like [Tetranychus urticae]
MLKKVFNSILITLITFITTVQSEDKYSAIKALRSDLLKNYDRYSRPVKQPSTCINVTFTLGIAEIIDVDIIEQTFHLSGVLILRWKDEFLTWDPSKYYGIKKLKFDSNEIWTPDIVVFNMAVGNNWIGVDSHSIIEVNYDGKINLRLPSNLAVGCYIDLADYPFDKQLCSLYFGSWSYNVNEIRLVKGKRLVRKPYFEQLEWSVEKIEGFLHDVKGFESHKSVVEIDISVARRVNIHLYYIAIPYLTASLLGLVAFLVPIGSIYRIVFGSLAIFILIFLLSFLADNIGFHSLGVPYAVRCISINIMLITISLVVTNMTYQLIMSLMVTCPPLPSFLAHHLTNPILARIFVLKVNLESTKFDEEANVNDFSNQQPFQSTSRAAIREWALLLRLIDRLLLITYIVVIIIYHS